MILLKILIIGQGGHSRVVTDIANIKKHHVIGYFDDKFSKMSIQEDIFYAPLSYVPMLDEKMIRAKWMIAIGNNYIRKKIVESIALPAERYTYLIHPSAIVSPSAEIGFGTVIMPNAVVNARAKIGRHVIVNTGAIVEHDNIIGDFVHLSPNTTLTGSVEVREGAQIGANATVIPGKTIGQWAVIGAGSTVIHSIPPYMTAVGSPARVKMKAGDKIVKHKV